jgi:hypothetical protein
LRPSRAYSILPASFIEPLRSSTTTRFFGVSGMSAVSIGVLRPRRKSVQLAPFIMLAATPSMP